jgi:hypothetical protein
MDGSPYDILPAAQRPYSYRFSTLSTAVRRIWMPSLSPTIE